jgi:hypothetical protein
VKDAEKITINCYGSGRFCSRGCANSRRHSKETKAKIGKSLKSTLSKRCNKKLSICKFCGKETAENNSRSWCSKDCKSKFYQSQSLIKYFTFNKECLGSELAFEEWDRVRNLLYDLYWNKGKSSNSISKIFNYANPYNLTGKIFNYLNIPKRTYSEASSNHIMHSHKQIEKHTQYKSGWHIAWNKKKVFLRSSYEFDFAEHLDNNKIDYEVEYLRIKYFDTQKQKVRIAIPDFYIPDSNEIIEIKSKFTLDKQNMIDKATEYINKGYRFSLMLDGKRLSFKDLGQ